MPDWIYDILYSTQRLAGPASVLVGPVERGPVQSVSLFLSVPSLSFPAFTDAAHGHIATDSCCSVACVDVCIDLCISWRMMIVA